MPNLFTDDVDRAADFYRDQLGFTQIIRQPPHGRAEHVVLRLGGSLLALSTPAAVTAVGLTPGAGRSLEVIVWCADVDGETARLRAGGVPVLVEPYRHVGGHRRSYVADPDGNWVALIDAEPHGDGHEETPC